MKKILVILLSGLISVAAIAAPVDARRAYRVAQTAARLYSWALLQQGKEQVTPDAECKLRDLTAEVGIPNIYVYDYTAPDGGCEGFVVVSGDDVADPILAFSSEGALEMNPAVRQHLQQYSRQIAACRKSGAVAGRAVRAKWEKMASGKAFSEAIQQFEAKGDIYNDAIGRLLGGMRWGQGNPYNRLCPGQSVTGCVATAFGMIMNYWDYPIHGFGQHSYNGADNPAAYGNWRWGELSADFEHTYYDWAHMDDYAVINSSDSVVEAIATLLYQVGVSLDMNYSPEGSGCWSLPEYATHDTSLHLSASMGADSRIPRHFGYKFGYAGMRDSVHSDSLWLRMLYNSLADSMPVYYAGWAKDDSEDGHSGTQGHGYILDGYFSDAIDSNMFHINWGWSGSANGYFKLDAMTPNGSDFTQWHGAIIGLEPDTSYHGYNPLDVRTLKTSTSIVYSEASRIVVKGCEGGKVAVYDMLGRLVAQRKSSSGAEWSVTVSPGVYVVCVGNQAGRKVAVLRR